MIDLVSVQMLSLVMKIPYHILTVDDKKILKHIAEHRCSGSKYVECEDCPIYKVYRAMGMELCDELGRMLFDGKDVRGSRNKATRMLADMKKDMLAKWKAL